MYVNPDNWKDCQKYYLGTYVKFKETGDVVYLIRQVKMIYACELDTCEDSDTTQHPVIFAEDCSTNETVIIDLLKGYTIEYVLPKKTTFQSGNNVSHITRIPAKQWKKGMSSENTKFSYLSGSSWRVQSFSIGAILNYINKPEYYTFEKAVAGFEQGVLNSAALTSRISVAADGSIYIDLVKVGKFYMKTKKLYVKKLFVSEISQVVSYKVAKVIE